MRDLTQGPVPGHLLAMAMPIAAGMLAQTLYLLIDLYFVAQLGDAALAGVGAAGIAMFVVMAVSQALGVGAMALISQAAGRKDADDANLIFNQAMTLGALCGIATLVAGYASTHWYMNLLGADAATAQAGTTYLYWFLPGLALQYVNTAMMSALRGTGVVQPTMVVQIATVLLNAILAPVLIAGVGTGKPLGVAGAGLATTIAVAAGTLMLVGYFRKLEKYVQFRRALWRPQNAAWARMVSVGAPAGGEFALMFLFMVVIYWVIRDFGAAAQAGFGLGSRLMQAIFLPAMAIAFATGPVAGQNYGAKQFARVRETLRSSAGMSVGIMVVITLLCQWRPEWLVRGFTEEREVVEVASHFLRLISWNFAAQAVIFTCSGVFQGLGHTLPALASSASRLMTFMLPAIWMSTQPWLAIDHVWYLSVASVWLQAGISLWLIARVMRQRLT
ncbi:MAG TPA: MATE family efflux transporter [Steroidobacteraceae bacterium]|nr:MATE family efflux transporter [Steroidobacteraceae bacterium]